jgi:hypothetical protein
MRLLPQFFQMKFSGRLIVILYMLLFTFPGNVETSELVALAAISPLIGRTIHHGSPTNPRLTPPTGTSSSGFIHQKRSIGCSQIDASNTSIYSTGGGNFEVFCDTAWHVSNSMYLAYTVDFVSCMNECILWNKIYSVQCVGVEWVYGIYGPGGVAGGSSCTFQWNMVLNQGFEQTGVDSARLQGVPLPTVPQLRNPLILVGEHDVCSPS